MNSTTLHTKDLSGSVPTGGLDLRFVQALIDDMAPWLRETVTWRDLRCIGQPLSLALGHGLAVADLLERWTILGWDHAVQGARSRSRRLWLAMTPAQQLAHLKAVEQIIRAARAG